MLERWVESAAYAAGEGIDRIFAHAAFRSGRASRRARHEASPAFLDRFGEAADFYEQRLSDGSLFPEPPAITPRARRLARLPGGAAWDLSWPSGWVALHSEYGDFTSSQPMNATCHARWWRHETPAPALICLHGWGGGHFRFEEHSFRARLLWRHGLDVLFFVLPYHARRGLMRPGLPLFPSVNPFRTNEGMAQAILDLRSLVAHVRHAGAPAVGVAGMSLGGFTSALLATVESSLDFVAPIIPFASVADMIWEVGSGSAAHNRAVESGLTHERLTRAMACTSPLTRTPAVPKERVLCIAGTRDRVIPRHHPERLRDHLSAHDVLEFPGSHMLQFGKEAALSRLIRFIDDLGIERERRLA
jgi:predicted esterase